MPIVVRPKEKQNPFELTEAEVYQTQSVSETDFTIGFDSVFHEERIYNPQNRQTVILRLKRARLELLLLDCRVATQGRAGNVPRPTQAVEKISRTKTQVKEGSLAAEASAEGGASGFGVPFFRGKFGGRASGKRSAGKTEKGVEKEERVRTSIRFLGNGKWEVTDVFEPVLKGRYVPEDHLCHIEVSDTSGGVEARVYFYPEDMDLSPTGESSFGFPKSSAKEPLIKALIAKGLRQVNESENAKDGRIVISRTSLSFIVEKEDE